MSDLSDESGQAYLRARHLLEDALHEADGSLACDIEEFLNATADGAPCPGCGVAPGALHGSTCVFNPSHRPPFDPVFDLLQRTAPVNVTACPTCGGAGTVTL